MTTTAQDLAQGAEGVEITEFESFDVQQVKGVREGANGFPILMMKSLPLAKGSKDCPCGKSYDADTSVENCENCGKKLPAVDASKARDEPKCKTCKDTGTIMDGNRDCPDCDAKPSAKSILVKAVTDGQIDEGPDISLGQQIMKLLAQAIQSEAQEIEAGSYGETNDVSLLNRAASMITMWVGRESSPGDDGGPDMGMLMDSAAIKAIVAEAVAEELVKADLSGKAINDLPDSAFAHIEPGGEKDEEGKTTPRKLRHFAIHDKAHADNAAARIAQGAKFGDEAKPKVLAAQKKFGSGTSKSTDVAEGETTVDTEAQGTSGLSKAVEEAVTKATADQKAELASLRSDLAKVLARPVPGGPVLSNARPTGAAGDDSENWAAKAALCRTKADAAISPSDRAGYVQLAREYDEKAAKAATAVTT